MFPAMWMPAKSRGVNFKGLYHVSAPFYVRLIAGEKKDDPPTVRIGSSSALGWEDDGQEPVPTEITQQPDRIGMFRGDVWTDGDTLVGPYQDFRLNYPQWRSYKGSPVPVRKRYIAPSGVPGSSAARALHTTRLGAAYESSLYGAAFIRTDGVSTYYAFNSASRTTFNTGTVTCNKAVSDMLFNAGEANDGYGGVIATRNYVAGADLGSNALADKGKIIVFQGRSLANDEGANEVPTWKNVGGIPVKGEIVTTRPVGHLGQDQAVFQQTSFERVENKNPKSGYVWNSPPGIDATKYRNQWANWGSNASIQYVVCGYVYLITLNAQGQLVRTERAKILNEWKQREGTPATLKDANGNTVEIAEIYDPVFQSATGTILCGIMMTENGIFETTFPVNDSRNINAFGPPGGLVEIHPTFWLANSRTTVFSDGSARWCYSRNGGQSWNNLLTTYTNGGVTNVGGATAVRHDMMLSKDRLAYAIQNEVGLAAATGNN